MDPLYSLANQTESRSVSSGRKKRSVDVAFPEYEYPGKPDRNSGRGGLKVYLAKERPKEVKRCIFFENDEFVVIYDAYPKSRIHLLIMAKTEFIKGISVLIPEHIPIIRGMIDLSQIIISHFADLGIEIWHGFHAIPSLSPLHLHLISTDFSEPALKKNIHWNSFTTAFFVAPEHVLSTLKSGNPIHIDKQIYKAIKNQKPLVCPKCWATFRMDRIKMHWTRCKSALEPIDRKLILHT